MGPHLAQLGLQDEVLQPVRLTQQKRLTPETSPG